MAEKTVYTVSEAQKILGVSEDAVRKLIREGQINSVYLGRKYYIMKKSFDEWIGDPGRETDQEKEEEMMITRTEMINRIEDVGSGVQEMLDQIRSSYEIRIRELNDKLSRLEAENNHYKVENARLSEDVNRLKTSCKQLTARIRFAQNHPVKFMIQGKDEELPGAEA